LFVGFRRWVQAVFRVSDSSNSSSCIGAEANHLDSGNDNKEIKKNSLNGGLNDSAVDLSEGVAVDMFGVLPSNEYEVRFSPLLSLCLFTFSSYKNINQIPCNHFLPSNQESEN